MPLRNLFCHLTAMVMLISVVREENLVILLVQWRMRKTARKSQKAHTSDEAVVMDGIFILFFFFQTGTG